MRAMLSKAIDYLDTNNYITNATYKGNTVSINNLDDIAQVDVNKNVIVLCPNVNSLATLCVLTKLRALDIDINAVVVRKVFSTKRFKHELKRDGIYWILQKFITKFLRIRFSVSRVVTGINNLSDEYKVNCKNVKEWCSASNTRYLQCETFNDVLVRALLEKNNQDLVIFTGGGIISPSIVKASGCPIMNCHGGILPYYRGLDLDRWPFIEKNTSYVGFTTHFMVEQVDAGDILDIIFLDNNQFTTLEEMRSYGEYVQFKLLIYSAVKYLNDEAIITHQNRSDGRQYFYMHRRLVPIADNIFEECQ
jgi:folate-dependent phosphoribosylglycinamide formyltransferase PurN